MSHRRQAGTGRLPAGRQAVEGEGFTSKAKDKGKGVAKAAARAGRQKARKVCLDCVCVHGGKAGSVCVLPRPAQPGSSKKKATQAGSNRRRVMCMLLVFSHHILHSVRRNR